MIFIKNKNITVAHKLVQHFPFVADFLINLGGLFLGIKVYFKSGLVFLYIHNVPERYLNDFKKLIIDLKKEFIFVSTPEAVELIKNDRINDKYIHLSFDDGFYDNYKASLCLKELGAATTFFVTTNLIDGIFDDIESPFKEEAMRQKRMSWGDIKAISDNGFEIGSHSCNHPVFCSLKKEDVYFEMVNSKKRLENKIQKEVVSFSFPYGRFERHFDNSHLVIARDVGYKYIFSTDLQVYKHGSDLSNYICRYGIEPYFSSRSVEILINGLLSKFR